MSTEVLDAILKPIAEIAATVLSGLLVAMAARAVAWVQAKAASSHLAWVSQLASTAVSAARQQASTTTNEDMKAFAVDLLVKRGVKSDIADAAIEAAVASLKQSDLWAPTPPEDAAEPVPAK